MSQENLQQDEADIEVKDKPEVTSVEQKKSIQEFANEIFGKIENEFNSIPNDNEEIEKVENSILLENQSTKNKIKDELDLDGKLGILTNEMRKIKEEAENRISNISIEASANSQENASLLLFGRMNNGEIRKQLIDLLSKVENYQTEQPDIELVYDENGDIELDNDGKPLVKKVPSKYKPRTKEELESELDENISVVGKDTPISFDPESHTDADPGRRLGGRELIALNDESFRTEFKDPLQRSIVEAHEKGHCLRPYDNEFFRRYFSPAFDLSKIEISQEEFERLKKLNKFLDTNMTYENSIGEFKEGIIEYLMSGPEVAERMSQLKNYFGMKGNELFTKEHLRYAKEHYIEDTKMDNNMTSYFQAITPEREDKFIELINTSGI